MGFEEDRQARAREGYARRMQEEERRRREAEERRRREEEARRRAEEQRAEEHRRQMEQQKQQREAESQSAQTQKTANKNGTVQGSSWSADSASQRINSVWERAASLKNVTAGSQSSTAAQPTGGNHNTTAKQNSTANSGKKGVNTFYTKALNSGTIVPRFDSIAAYNSAISEKQKKLDAMNHQQYLLMLQNDVSGMAALDAPIKAAEKDLDGLKIGLGDIMGANIHGKVGNQLTGNEKVQQNDGRAPQVGKPLFAANDEMAHAAGLNYPRELGYPKGSPPVEGPPPREEDMGNYEEDVEESQHVGDEEIGNWENQVLDFFQDQHEGKKVTESLPGPEPQAPPIEFIREDKGDDAKDEKKRDEDYKAFVEALGGLADFSGKNKTDDISSYAQKAIETIKEGGELDKSGLLQTNLFSYGSVYVIPMDDADVELEVLSQAALPEYGGKGTELQEAIDKVKQLFWPPFSNEFTTTLGVIEGAIEDYYEPGQILQPGDTRITVSSFAPIANQQEIGIPRYTIDYYFRGSDLLYSKDAITGEVIWGDRYKQ